MPDLGTQIATARQAGYSDADITAYLAKDPGMGPKVAQAKAAGYEDADIVSHLSGSAKAPNAFAHAAQIAGDEIHKATDAYKADIASFAQKGLSGQGHSLGDYAAPVLDAVRAVAAPVKGVADAALGDKPLHLPAKILGMDVPQWAQNVNSKGLTGGDVGTFAVPTAAEAVAAKSIARVAQGAGVTARTMDNALSASRAPASIAAAKPNGLAANISGAVRKVQGAPAPSLDDLQAAKSAAYAAVDQAGVQYKPEAIQGMLSGIKQNMDDANLNALVHPKAAAVIQKLQDVSAAGKSPTLTELDQMRQYVKRDLMGSRSDDGERFMGRQIVNGIDDFISSAKPADLAVGDDPRKAAALISSARNANTVFRKVEGVTDALDGAAARTSATGSGGNIDNATRQAINKQLQKIPNLTDDEKDAMRQIVAGSHVQNALRNVGKLSPQGNGLMATLETLGTAGGLVAGGTHGAAIGVVPAAIGMVAKFTADTMTARKANALLNLMASGGDKAAAAKALADPQTSLWAVRLAKAANKSGDAFSSAAGRLGAAAKTNQVLVPLFEQASQTLRPAAPLPAAATTNQEPAKPQQP